jgi:uncharacterized protein (TIGR02271 family)
LVVRAADGHRLGKVVEADPSTFIIEKGWLFHKDYACSYGEIADINDDEIRLRSGATTLREAEGGKGPARSMGFAASRPMASREDNLTSAPLPPVAPRTTADISGLPRADERDTLTVTLSEEELRAEKHLRDAGRVIVKKEVITEEKTLRVPVTHDEVRIEHRPASAGARPSDTLFQETATTIPLSEEEVEVVKRPFVREEVRVVKQPVTDERTVSVMAQKEVLEVIEEHRPGASKLSDENLPLKKE